MGCSPLSLRILLGRSPPARNTRESWLAPTAVILDVPGCVPPERVVFPRYRRLPPSGPFVPVCLASKKSCGERYPFLRWHRRANFEQSRKLWDPCVNPRYPRRPAGCSKFSWTACSKQLGYPLDLSASISIADTLGGEETRRR